MRKTTQGFVALVIGVLAMPLIGAATVAPAHAETPLTPYECDTPDGTYTLQISHDTSVEADNWYKQNNYHEPPMAGFPRIHEWMVWGERLNSHARVAMTLPDELTDKARSAGATKVTISASAPYNAMGTKQRVALKSYGSNPVPDDGPMTVQTEGELRVVAGSLGLARVWGGVVTGRIIFRHPDRTVALKVPITCTTEGFPVADTIEVRRTHAQFDASASVHARGYKIVTYVINSYDISDHGDSEYTPYHFYLTPFQVTGTGVIKVYRNGTLIDRRSIRFPGNGDSLRVVMDRATKRGTYTVKVTHVGGRTVAPATASARFTVR